MGAVAVTVTVAGVILKQEQALERIEAAKPVRKVGIGKARSAIAGPTREAPAQNWLRGHL